MTQRINHVEQSPISSRSSSISDLTFLVMSTHAWSRLNIAFKSVPGSSDKVFGLDKAMLA